MNFDPYHQAGAVDAQISQSLRIHRINRKSARRWLTFTRTIRSTLNIIDEVAHSYLETETKNKTNTSTK